VAGQLAAVAAEQVLQPVPAVLQSDQAQPQLVDHVAHQVIGSLVRRVDQHAASLDARVEPGRGQSGGQRIGPVLDLDPQRAGALRE
jgi:hypothetical protein